LEIINSIAEMRAARRRMREPVGFVPTMGFLHEGHMSLVHLSRANNAATVVSIFVNPTQFGEGEDFTTYPRDTERDLAMLREAGTDYVFMPVPAEMYPPQADTWVDVGGVTEPLEGASRPGHFRGVATVVAKLFNIVRPDNAYFGQKDAQQLAVIKKMAADLDMPLKIIAGPTVREPDGLAMSSRNTYLNAEERRAALVLSQALKLAEKRHHEGDRDAGAIRRDMTAIISAEPLAKIDYVSIADNLTLTEVDAITGEALVSMAVRVGQTRLIDNIVLS
jgi:pantoate--beta-alanine ligase